jgi:hypothetical protein
MWILLFFIRVHPQARRILSSKSEMLVEAMLGSELFSFLLNKDQPEKLATAAISS